jgi:ATP-dependent DNA ligase
MFKAFEFCLPIKAASVPDRPNWLREIKYDGYRVRLERDGDRVRLITKAGTIGPTVIRGSSRPRARTA